MKYIGNILTKNLFTENKLYNVVSSKSDLIEGIPTLCIGKEFTAKNYPEFNIIEFKVCDDVYWTYGPREKRNIYESRLSAFMDIAVERFIKDLGYVFVNVLTSIEKNDNCKRIAELLKLENKTTSFIYNDMAYIYDEERRTVLGVSLRDLKYIDRDVNKFISSLYRKTRVVDNKNDLSFEVRSVFYGHYYAIPCLYY